MEKKIRLQELLPEDLVIEILKCLPVKSLAQFRCVSKTWCNFIKSPAFIDDHLQKERTNGTVLMLMRSYRRPLSYDCLVHSSSRIADPFILSFHGVDSPKLEKCWPNVSIPKFPDTRTKHWYQDPHILGPCKGLICVIRLGSAYICNPGMQQFKLLPHCASIKPVSPNSFAGGSFEFVSPDHWGFGTCHDNSFKVLRLQGIVREYGKNRVMKTLFEPYLYHSTSGFWNHISGQITTLTFSESRSPKSELSFNGTCHWLIEPISEMQISRVILTFEINTEIFRRLECPESLRKEYEGSKWLMVLGECLAMVYCAWKRPFSFVVWVMKEYGIEDSWSKQLVIEPPIYYWKNPLLFWKNGKSLLMDSDDKCELISYESHTDETERFQIHGVEETLGAAIYRESLISVN